MSDGGKIYSCQKYQLTSILVEHNTLPDQEPEADGIIIDGSALVHALPPKRSKTFADHAALDFLPRISACANAYKTTHILLADKIVLMSVPNLVIVTKGPQALKHAQSESG